MRCNIISNDRLADRFHYLTLAPEQAISSLGPGRFVMVRCGHGADPYLRRPMSLANYSANGDKFALLIQNIGAGTRLLCHARAGQNIDIIGPYGNGFDIETLQRHAPGGRVWMVAGGTGIAPFMGLVNAASARGFSFTIFMGARTGDLIFFEDFFAERGVTVKIATEDGSKGFGGLVTALLSDELTAGQPPETVLSCGPDGMMLAAATICRKQKIRCQISLERRMACGFGACLGCVVETPESGSYKTACRKGPVFDANEVYYTK